MTLDFKEDYNNERRIKELKELLKNWGYKTENLNYIELMTYDEGSGIMIKLGYNIVE